MTEVMRRHLDALDAMIALLQAQAVAVRHSLQAASSVEAMRPVLPARCQGVLPQACALQDDDARQSRATFSNPQAWICRGCEVTNEGIGAG